MPVLRAKVNKERDNNNEIHAQWNLSTQDTFHIMYCYMYYFFNSQYCSDARGPSSSVWGLTRFFLSGKGVSDCCTSPLENTISVVWVSVSSVRIMERERERERERGREGERERERKTHVNGDTCSKEQ